MSGSSAASDERDARARDVSQRRESNRERAAQLEQAKRQRRQQVDAASANPPGAVQPMPASRKRPRSPSPVAGDGSVATVAGASPPAATDEDDLCVRCDSDGTADDEASGCEPCRAPPRRVRTDAVLRLRPPALAALRAVLCGDLRLTDARKARGDG